MPNLQYALIQAAKVGHVKLMREFIEEGASPFLLDQQGHSAIFYATIENPKETADLLKELTLLKGDEDA